MQKKIIALAVAGLVSGAAFAQSNVTIYGIADVGYQYSGKSHVANQKAISKIIDGGQDGSRVGFKGTEDLGNGLSAFFNIEQSFSLDTAAAPGGRNSNIGLSGKSWGTIKAGSFGSVHDDYNGFSEAGGMGWGNGVIGMLATGDARNAVEYVSPNFSGLEFKLGASTQYTTANAQELADAVDTNDNNRAFFGAVAYQNGGLKVALTADRSKFQTAAPGTKAASEWLIGGSYNFGPVILGAGYDRTDYSNDDERATWRINVGAPIGANDNVALSYSRTKFDWVAANVADSKASGWGVSYSHAMSKRTNIYATYGQMSQDDDLNASGVHSTRNQAIDGSYERAFKVGMRHFF